MKWIASAGGPLLLLPVNLRDCWDGIDPPSNNRKVEARFRWKRTADPATDYDRACDVDDYLGILEVGPGTGLVLGGEPMETAWIPQPTEGGGLLVRWMWAEDDASVERALAVVPEKLWQRKPERFAFQAGPLALFDAACSGKQALESIEIDVQGGTYNLETATYRPDDLTSLVLHRLRRARSACQPAPSP